MASDEEMLDVHFPRQYMSLTPVSNSLGGMRVASDDDMLEVGGPLQEISLQDVSRRGLFVEELVNPPLTSLPRVPLAPSQDPHDDDEEMVEIGQLVSSRGYIRLRTIEKKMEALASQVVKLIDPTEQNPGRTESTSSALSGESRIARTYDNFDTVDWVKDLNADSDRRHRMEQRAQYSMMGRLLQIWDSSSGWLCVGLIGALVGLFALIIDIGVSWLSNLKEGICVQQPWFNKEQCCWSYNMTIASPLYYSPHGSVSNTDNQSELLHPHIPGSGAQSAYGYYTCDQWYSWERLLTGHDGDLQNVGAFILGWIIYVLLSLGMMGLCSALVFFIAPSAAGSGIAEVKTILGGFVIRNFLGPWTLIVKVAGLILSVSTGLCIGNDGPIVHVGACCASILSRFFPKYGLNPSKTRELISAAVAGGIGACFGAPIGGVLFSLEVASYYFPAKTLFRSFFCALAAAYVARAMNPFGDEHLIMLSVGHDATWHFVELIPFAVLGVCGGMFGALVVRGNKAVQNFRRTRCARRPITYLLLLTVAFSIIAYLHPDLRVEEKLYIRKLVSSCTAGDQEDLCDYVRVPLGGFGNATIVSETNLVGSFPAGPRMVRGVALLFAALIVKFIGLVLVYGVPVPTGVMLPSIMVGAILGRLMGITVEQIVVSLLPNSPLYQTLCKPGHPCIDTGLYAAVGAAACLGGVTRATVSLVVIMIEVIGGLSYSIPIMVAGMFAKWTGDRLYSGSLYDVQIRLNHYPYLRFDKSSNKLGDAFASDIMHPRLGEGPLEMLTENSMTVCEVEELLYASGHNGFPVVESIASRHLVGFVSRGDLVKSLDIDRPHSTRRYVSCAIVCFTDRTPLVDQTTRFSMLPGFDSGVDNSNNDGSNDPLLVDVQNIVDLSPTTLTQATPASTIFDVFRKLGLRQVLITHLGRLTGIITKKDVLRFLDDA